MMEGLLNRWRGTGKILGPVTGVQIYTIYIVGMVWLASTWYWGITAGLAFMIGESMSWGKWVGYLTSENAPKDVGNIKGSGFPYIHQTAELIVKQTENYRKYCQVSLGIRGVYWWLPVLSVMYLAGVVSWWYVVIGSVVAGAGFPVACELGKNWKYTLQSRWLNMHPGWENQEVVYGLVQMLLVTVPVIVKVIG